MAAALVARLSGIVAYTDDTKVEFAVHLDGKGNLSYNSKTGLPTSHSVQSMVENKADATARLNAMFALLAGLTFNGPSGTAVRKIKDLTAELSGRVALASPTPGSAAWQDFIVQYTVDTGAYAPKGGSNTTAWPLAKSVGLASLNSMFTNLGIVAS